MSSNESETNGIDNKSEIACDEKINSSETDEIVPERAIICTDLDDEDDENNDIDKNGDDKIIDSNKINDGDDDNELVLTNKPEFFLPLDLIQSDNETGSTVRKRIYDTDDDVIINQIFSQSITSAGVTPSEESENFLFESGNIDQEDQLKNKINDNDCIDQIDLTIGIDDLKATSEPIDIKPRKKPQPCIVIDCYDEELDSIEPCYVEPITPKQIKSYFDTTIVDEEPTIDTASTTSSVEIDYKNYEEIQLTDIEVYKSVSNDDHSLTKNGTVFDINSKVFLDDNNVSSGSDETNNSNDSIGESDGFGLNPCPDVSYRNYFYICMCKKLIYN